MANIVTIKRSNVANKQPVAADLVVGELAVNFPDAQLYTKDPANQIVPLGGAKPPKWITLTGTLSVPLDGNSYEYQIPAGSTESLAYTLPANDATTTQYGALLKITAPAAGTNL